MGKIGQYVNDRVIVTAAVLSCMIVTAFTAIRLGSFSAEPVKVNLEEMFGQMLIGEEGSRYIDSGESGWVLYGPYLTLDKGYYRVDINYSTDNDTSMDIHSQVFSDYIVSNDIVLSSINTSKSFHIRLKDRVDDFDIRINYSGEGHLEINSITIIEETTGIRKNAFCAYALIILLTVCYLCREKLEDNKTTVIILVAIAVLSCVPEMTRGIDTGDDGIFHLLRIEGLAQGLRMGEFPVRMQSNWMEGYGYPVSIYYGDLLLYIPALLRVAGFSATQSYKLYLLFINFGTTAIAYVCFHKIVRDTRAALFGTAAYVLAVYRFTNIYVRLAVGEYSTMMFLPIILLAVYGIYTDDAAQLRKYAKNAVLLAVGMTGIIQTHLISVIMVSLVIAVVCIVMIKKTLRRNTLLVYICAIIMTVALNLFFIVPFMDCARNEAIQIFYNGEDAVLELIQEKGAYIGQYFMLYKNAFGENSANSNIGDRKAFTPGVLLILTLLISMYFCFKQNDKMMKFLTYMSVLILWMASNLFPWNFIIQHLAFMGWIRQIQFPWRFLTIAQLFLSLLLCFLLEKTKGENRGHAERMFFTVLVVSSAMMFSGVIENGDYYEIYDATAIDSFAIGNGEYLRTGTSTDCFDGQIHTRNVDIIEDYTRKGKYAIIKCQTADNGDNAWIEFPIIHYKNYVAYGENGIRFPIADGVNNVIRVMVPNHYSGIVAVAYEVPLFYRIADICSLIAVIGLGVITFFIIQKENLVKEKK